MTSTVNVQKIRDDIRQYHAFKADLEAVAVVVVKPHPVVERAKEFKGWAAKLLHDLRRIWNAPISDHLYDAEAIPPPSKTQEKLSVESHDKGSAAMVSRHQKDTKLPQNARKKAVSPQQFTFLCQKFIESLEHINNSFDGKVIPKDKLDGTKTILNLNEVWVSFHGIGNSGKSTLLNAILGDTYFPTKTESETSVPVRVYFNSPSQSKTEVSRTEKADILCHNGATLARGTKDIRKKIQQINKDWRQNKQRKYSASAVTDYSIYVSASFHEIVVGRPKVVMVDNPGWDEHGCINITEVTERAKEMSSCFIIVTAMDCYNKKDSFSFLKKLYQENMELLSENRLIIVVTKIDNVLINDDDDDDEAAYTEELIVEKVRKHLCESVFNIPIKSIPKDIIFPVCGKWATLGKQYRNSPTNENLEGLILEQIHRAARVYKNCRELPVKEAADWLLEHSNLQKLEIRLKQVAERSQIIHYQQLSKQLSRYMGQLKSKLEEKIAAEDREIKALTQYLESLHKEVKNLVDFYAKLIKKTNFKGENSIFQELKAAFDRDMEDPNNIKFKILHFLPSEVTIFKDDCKKKIKSSQKYGPTHFQEDMEAFLTKKTKDFEEVISKWKNYALFSTAYRKNCSDLYLYVSVLKNTLKKSLHKSLSSNRDQDMPLLVPEVVAPLLNTTINIPEGRLGLFRRIWESILKILRRITGQETETPKIKVNVKSGKVEKTSHDASIQEEMEYTTWTTELNDSVNKMQKEMENLIREFYEDSDKTIIEKVCDQYYGVGMKLLRAFDKFMADDLSEFFEKVESEILILEKHQKTREEFESCVSQINSMLEEFTEACHSCLQ